MAEGAVLLHGFAKPVEVDLLADLRDIVEQAPFRHMVTPGGHQMSVAMTNCGGLGLINRYQPGARMSLHQDEDEEDFAAPIVSVSLGLPAIFLFGGLKRSDTPRRFRLQHGDIAVWGGPARLRFHGIAPLADGEHALLGRQRINLTFRKAL